MAPPSSRDEVLRHLRSQLEAKKPIVGAGAGTGLSAKFIEAGGADLIIIYNSGRFRMAGRGSLAGLMPYGDANAVVVDMAREVLPIVHKTGVLAGVCGTDPFRIMSKFLGQLKEMGFCGVQNFPVSLLPTLVGLPGAVSDMLCVQWPGALSKVCLSQS